MAEGSTYMTRDACMEERAKLKKELKKARQDLDDLAQQHAGERGEWSVELGDALGTAEALERQLSDATQATLHLEEQLGARPFVRGCPTDHDLSTRAIAIAHEGTWYLFCHEGHFGRYSDVMYR